MTTLFITMIVFGVLVIIHEWGHFIVAKYQGIQVDIFSIGFGPKLFTYKWHNTLYAISLIPLGGYIKMAGDDIKDTKGIQKQGDFFAKTPWQRMKVAMAGPIMNYFLAYILFVIVFAYGVKQSTSQVGEVMPNWPADQAGLLANDKIISVNNQPVKSWNELTLYIRCNTSSQIDLDIIRQDKKMNIAVKFKDKQDRTQIGIKPSGENIFLQYSLPESLFKAKDKLLYVSYKTYQSLWLIITGKLSLKKSMTGPIGIMFITGKTAKKGWIYVLYLMGLISAALALFNFLPIPLLDGGHFVLYLIEWICRKPVNVKIQDVFNKVGVVFLFGLMLVVFYNDLVNFKIISKIRNLWPTYNKQQNHALK